MRHRFSRIDPLVLWIALIALGAGGCIWWLGDRSATKLFVEHMAAEDLRRASAIAAHAEGAGSREAALEAIEQTWLALPDRTPGTFVCVIADDGELLLNTLRPEKVGVDVGAVPVAAPGAGPATVRDLLDARGSWTGRNVNHAGAEQVAAYTYSPDVGGLVALHVPLEAIEAEIAAAMLPLTFGLGVVLLILLPTALTLIQRRHGKLEATLHARVGERDAAEHELRRSEARYRDLYDNAPDMFISVDAATGLIADCNAMLETKTGMSREQLIGLPIGALYADSCRAKTVRALERFRMHGRLDAVELRMRRADGTDFPVELNSSAVVDDEGRILKSRSVVRDRSALEAARLEGDELRAQLLHAQKLDAIGKLVAGVAHDLNNALTAILGNCELLRTDGVQGPDADTRLEAIHLATLRACGVAERTLALSRPRDEAFASCSLREVVEETLTVLAVKRPFGVELELADGDAMVVADRSQLHQALVNLVINAWQAQGGAGGRVQIAIATPDREGASVALLTVTDDGPGIAPEHLAHVTEPFFTTKPEGQGTGLGLAMVRSIVERHRGDLRIESVVGRGTTVTLELPRVDRAAAPRPRPRLAPVRAAASGRIAIVDDDDLVRTMVATRLEASGFEVTAFEDGRSALESWATADRCPDLVVTDYCMPGMSGVELAERLRERWAHVPVMLMSGLSSQVTASDHDKVDRFLSKPFQGDELLEAVESLLARSVA